MIVLLLSPFQIESHLALLEMLPVGRQAHNHVRRILNGVAGLGGGPAADGQANNRHDTESTATATLSTSAVLVSTLLVVGMLLQVQVQAPLEAMVGLL